MSVTVEMQNTGDLSSRSEIVAAIEHVFGDRAGEWRVAIVGTRESENWEMTIDGPNGFQRSYLLTGGAGEHQPEVIRALLPKLLPATRRV